MGDTHRDPPSNEEASVNGTFTQARMSFRRSREELCPLYFIREKCQENSVELLSNVVDG